MSEHTVEYRQRCKACRGTGLFRGMGEMDGAAIVCHNCKGEGYEDIVHEYDDFVGLVDPPDGITQVYATNPGIVVNGQGAVPGGVALDTWVSDPASVREPGNEMRKHTCPAWWYQGTDYDKKPHWTDGEQQCGWGSFSSCDFFAVKAGCWERWDRENRVAS